MQLKKYFELLAAIRFNPAQYLITGFVKSIGNKILIVLTDFLKANVAERSPVSEGGSEAWLSGFSK